MYEIASEFSEVSKQNQIVQVEPNIAYETCMPGPALEPNIAYEVVGFEQQNSKLCS